MPRIRIPKLSLKKPKMFTYLFFMGVGDGLILSSMSDLAFAFFVERSLLFGIAVLFVFIAVLLASWVMSTLIPEMNTGAKMRQIFLGISIASLFNFILKLAISARRGVLGGIIVLHGGSPYISIMGVPFSTIIWSLFLSSLFATIERLIKVWEEL